MAFKNPVLGLGYRMLSALGELRDCGEWSSQGFLRTSLGLYRVTEGLYRGYIGET